ncbi:unnamed protein product, partial [Ambrosiozyma monospora]
MSNEPPNQSPYFYSSSPSQMQQQQQQQEPLQDDLLMAAQALGQLKQNSPPVQSSPQQQQSQTLCQSQPDDQRRQSNPTIFDKVIAQSINYMLEKTISTSNNYVMEDVQHSNSATSLATSSDVASKSGGISNSQYQQPTLQQGPQLHQPQLPLPIPQTQSQTYPYNSSSAMVPPNFSEHLKRSSTTISTEDDESTLKRPRLTPQSTTSLRSTTLPPLTSSTRFPRFNPNLRQHVT